MGRLSAWKWILIAVFAGWFNWAAGHRGLFLYDVSIIFDGGWRVLQGQVPYRDYFTAHAPGAYFYEALIFRLFGVTYSSMVLAACILNIGAALLAVRIVDKLTGGFGWLAGITTAIWFQPITGFLQIEQCAFFFDIVTLGLLVEAGTRMGAGQMLLRCGSGVALAYAVLCKQNAGGLFVPFAGLALLVFPFVRMKDRFLAFLSFVAGGVVCTAAFAAWLFTFSNPSLFWHHAVDLPLRFGSGRMSAGVTALERLALFGGTGPFLAYPTRTMLAVGVLVMAYELWFRRAFTWNFVCGYLLFTLGAFQDLFASSALNDPENAAPFLGVQLGLTAGLFRALAPSLSFISPNGSTSDRVLIPATHWGWKVMGGVAAAAIVVFGMSVAWGRRVNEFQRGARFSEHLNVPGATRILWGEPTFADGAKKVRIEKSDVEQTAAYLRTRGENFFVFPVSTMFYGLLHRPSVQPWLFFLEGHSFTKADIPRLDDMTVASLEKNHVTIWVRETSSFMGEHTDLPKFPKTWKWLTSEFHPTATFGVYEILEKNNSRSEMTAR
jgi:hypothetical protein